MVENIVETPTPATPDTAIPPVSKAARHKGRKPSKAARDEQSRQGKGSQAAFDAAFVRLFSSDPDKRTHRTNTVRAFDAVASGLATRTADLRKAVQGTKSAGFTADKDAWASYVKATQAAVSRTLTDIAADPDLGIAPGFRRIVADLSLVNVPRLMDKVQPAMPGCVYAARYVGGRAVLAVLGDVFDRNARVIADNL